MYAFHEKHLDTLVSFLQSLAPLADKTVYLQVPGLNEALAPLGESLGFEIGMLKVFIHMNVYICMCLCWYIFYMG